MSVDIANAIRARYRMKLEPIQLFRPCTVEQFDAVLSTSLELLITGGNRSGKTYLALMLFASRVLGIPLVTYMGNMDWVRQAVSNAADAANNDENYEPLRKYLASHGRGVKNLKLNFPVPSKEFPRLYWIVGRDEKHIGERMYKFLFEPGHVKLLKDQITGRVRIYNPADPRDREREQEVIAAEPIIPSRFIVPGSWKWVKGKKGQDVFSEVTLISGAIIRAYGTNTKPVMGDEIDGCYIDEDLTNAEWLSEIQRRLLSREGWFIWAVWPTMKNFAVINLQQRVKNKDPHIFECSLSFPSNPFAAKRQKERSTSMAGSEEEVRRREYGETLADKLTMYQVSDEMHGLGAPARAFALANDSTIEGRQRYLATLERKIDQGKIVSRQELLTHIWDEAHGFPPEWTRYMAIDPSNTRTAVVFGVVPPPELCGIKMARTVIIENELVREQTAAPALAMAVKQIARNLHYEAFIMDRRAGRQTHAGRDTKTSELYEAAFTGQRLYSRLSKHGFIPGIDVPNFRYETVRSFIDGAGGVPDLYYVRYGTPHLQYEFQTYRKKRTTTQDGTVQILDQPANPMKYDVMAALEYLLAYLDAPFTMGVAYQPPSAYAVEVNEDGLPDLAVRMQKYRPSTLNSAYQATAFNAPY